MYFSTLTLLSWMIVGKTLAVDSNLLKSYDMKVCRNEPSCHLVDQQNLPKSRRTLEGRDCMCDFECVEYNDCCKDSEFYGAATPTSGATYSCSPNGNVYMITSCPPTYTDESVISKCLASTQPLDGGDSSVIRPATNLKKRVTYGNAYCAQCNNDIDDIVLWNVTAGCGEAPNGYLDTPKQTSQPPQAPQTTNEFTSSYYTPEDNEVSTPSKNLFGGLNNKNAFPSENAANKNTGSKAGVNLQIPLTPGSFFGNKGSVYNNRFNVPGFGGINIQVTRKKRENLSLDFNKYAKDLDNILKNVKYDPFTNNFISQYNGREFICQFASKMPKNFELYVRKCVPNMVSTCPPETDKETFDKCLSYTAIVYEKSTKKAFKNRDCAKCNGVPEIAVTGCPQAERTAGSSLFSTSDKGSGAPCNTPALKKKFCS